MSAVHLLHLLKTIFCRAPLLESTALRVWVIEAVCLFEHDFPRSELNYCIHALVHLVVQIRRYGPHRNTWMFSNESYNGESYKGHGQHNVHLWKSFQTAF